MPPRFRATPALVIAAMLAGCSLPITVEQDTDAHSRRPFEDEALAVAANFRTWSKLTRTPQWAPTLCVGPPPSALATAHLSASEDRDTHGQKLYHLYALDPLRYFEDTDMSSVMLREEPVRGTIAGIDQAIIKDAFAAIAVGHDTRTFGGLPSSDDGQTAYADSNTYKPGEHVGQFIMMHDALNRPGTDKGWVYATTDTRGRITAIGQIQSCIDCHRKAPHGRRFGLSTLSKPP